MLKILIRCAGAAIAFFLVLLAGVYMGAAEPDSLPDAEAVASVSFAQSGRGHDEIISGLTKYVDDSGVRVVHVVPDPTDFLHIRNGYEFGTSAQTLQSQKIEWFTSGMRGTRYPATQLGDARLDGTYVLYGDAEKIRTFDSWVGSHLGAESTTDAKTPMMVAQVALFSLGAWTPVVATFLILAASILAWYALRAGAREKAILGGMKLSIIVLRDLFSVLGALFITAIPMAVIAVGLAMIGGQGRILEYAAAITVAFIIAVVIAAIIAVLVSLMTLPEVRSIAERTPPERSSWKLSEMLTVVTALLAAAMIPLSTLAVTTTVQAESTSGTWADLGDSVAIRSRGLPEKEAQNMQLLGALVRAADSGGTAMLGMDMGPRWGTAATTDPSAVGANLFEGSGFDGVVMVNQRYLDAVSGTVSEVKGSLGSGVQTIDLTENEGSTALVQKSLAGLHRLLAPGQSDTGIHLLRYTGDKPLPIFNATDKGTLLSFSSTLVILIDDFGTVLKPDALGSFTTNSTILLTDATWAHEYLGAHPDLAQIVLSLDRVADVGLLKTQQYRQQAALETLSLGLVALSLVLTMAVAAWVYALLRQRRLFVARVAGMSWPRILQGRTLWSVCVAALAALTCGLASSIAGALSPWWAVPVFIVVCALGIGAQFGTAKATFSATSARRG